jgi:protein-tyrosine phosphatase
MAEGIFRHKALDMQLTVKFDSCGTGGWHSGESPDHRAQSCLIENGIDISDLRARQFSVQDFERFDLIYTMDESNYKDVVSLARNESQLTKVKLILEETYPGKNRSVPDPYFGGKEGFDEVYKMLDAVAEVVLKQIKKQMSAQ